VLPEVGAGVGHGKISQHQGFQNAARAQLAVAVGSEAVKAAVTAIFGLIDPAGRGIHGDGLVVESPHVHQGLESPRWYAPTSKLKPCGLVTPLEGGTEVFSSHVTQLPQGVRPPAQLLNVPAIEAKCSSSLPCWSNTSVVVPPRQAGSYMSSGGATTCGLLASPPVGASSWFRTRMVVPRGPSKAAMPS
jgi:hypothetical protein